MKGAARGRGFAVHDHLSVADCRTLGEFSNACPRQPDGQEAFQLLDRAVPRVFVVAPALELRAVADAVAADVVEGHLGDELRAHLRSTRARGRRPSGWRRRCRARRSRRERGTRAARASAWPGSRRCGRPPGARPPRRRDPGSASRACPPPCPGRQPTITESIVRTRFTFTIPVRSPGRYGASSSLAITPSAPCSHWLRRPRGRGSAGEVERLSRQLLEPLAPRGERLVEQHLAVLLEQVEGHEPRRRRLGQPAHPRLRPGGCAAGARRSPACRPRRGSPARRRARTPRRERQLREIAAQRAPVADWRSCSSPSHEGDRPEAVPLGLVGPAVALGELGPRAAPAGAAAAGRAGHALGIVKTSSLRFAPDPVAIQT